MQKFLTTTNQKIHITSFFLYITPALVGPDPNKQSV
jgi:hypothetical protein